ncbi:MAG: molybdate ABC transporter substrate-binding protein [Hyphomicrobiaceae bacterium]
MLTRRSFVAVIAGLTLGTVAFAQEKSAHPAATPTSGTVIVFAAASLKTALDAVATQWTASSGQKVTISYAASGSLAKQIENGAPADLFAPADVKWMDYAADKKLIVAETRTSLLGNKLVLIAPRDQAGDLKIAKGFKLAEAIGDGRLATGDPKSVPAGTYAQAALTSLGVWDAVAPKIAGAASVRGALAFVARGEAKLGIVYQTDANSEPKVRIVDTFPSDSHPPIVYPFALTARSTNKAAADFLAFLKTPAAAKVFAADGFTVLP